MKYMITITSNQSLIIFNFSLLKFNDGTFINFFKFNDGTFINFFKFNDGTFINLVKLLKNVPKPQPQYIQVPL